MALWGLEWRSKNNLSEKTGYLMWNTGMPLLFRTRKSAREYAEKYYGYIKKRKDLRTDPHNWRMPRPVKVTIEKLDD